MTMTTSLNALVFSLGNHLFETKFSFELFNTSNLSYDFFGEVCYLDPVLNFQNVKKRNWGEGDSFLN